MRAFHRTTLLLSLLLASGILAAQGRPVVGIGGIMHESNSFNPAKTTLQDYDIQEPAPGNDVLARWERSISELSGYIAGAKEAGFDIYPAFLANATPKGPLTDD